MKDRGTVLAVSLDMASVRVDPQDACSCCKGRSFCQGGKGPGASIQALNPVHARPGDLVIVDVPVDSYNRAWTLIFGTLSAASLLGLAIGIFLGPLFRLSSAAAGLAGLLVCLAGCSIWLRRRFSAKNKKSLFPAIREILDKGESHG